MFLSILDFFAWWSAVPAFVGQARTTWGFLYVLALHNIIIYPRVTRAVAAVSMDKAANG